MYCVWCGCKHVKKAEKCMACGKKLDPKERLLVDFLVEHTKDKFKGDLEDSLYEAIKNYLLSHLYSVVVGIALVGAVTAAVAAPKPDRHIQPVEQPPVIIEVAPETTAPVVEEEPVVEYYQLTEQDKANALSQLTNFALDLEWEGMTAGTHVYIYFVSEELEIELGYDSLTHMYADRLDEVVYPFAPVTKGELVPDYSTWTTVPSTVHMQQLMDMGYPVASLEVAYTIYEEHRQPDYSEYELLGTSEYLITFAQEEGQWLMVEQISLTHREEEREEALLP